MSLLIQKPASKIQLIPRLYFHLVYTHRHSLLLWKATDVYNHHYPQVGGGEADTSLPTSNISNDAAY